MKKQFKLLGALLLVFLMASCSGSYSEKTCEQLRQKISDKQELSNDDVNKMLNQLEIIYATIDKTLEKAKKDPQKAKDYADKAELGSMVYYSDVFVSYIYGHGKNFSEKDQERAKAIVSADKLAGEHLIMLRGMINKDEKQEDSDNEFSSWSSDNSSDFGFGNDDKDEDNDDDW